MGTFTNVARSLPSMKAALFTFFRKYLGIFGRKDVAWLQKMVLEQGNLLHFELVFSNAVNSFSIYKELEVKDRVEGGEQFPIFEVPREIYINEFVEEIVDHKKSVMDPCYLIKDRSSVEKTFEKIIDADINVKWWFKNGVNKVEYLGLKYFFPANRVKSFYPDYVVQYTDGTIGVFETKSRGDDENFGGFNEKTKRKAEAMFIWKKALAEAGIQVRAGIVLVVSEKSVYLNEKDHFDLEKAINNDLSDWTPFK
jgi:type III restriction enzyme